jgi:DNA anti-recombination protein RmuC
MTLTAFRPSIGAMREADLRRTREAERLLQIKAQVRSDLRAERRLRAIGVRLQPLFDRLEADLHEQRREAARRGERSRVSSIERAIDSLVDEFNELARAIVEEDMK